MSSTERGIDQVRESAQHERGSLAENAKWLEQRGRATQGAASLLQAPKGNVVVDA